jgi:uncharacterized protein YrzB (UPF0473 family)
MAKAVAKVEEVHVPAQPAAETDSLLNLIERAARDPNVDIDKMERLFGMRERMQAQASKTSYLAALAVLQAALPAVERKGTGHNQKKYARFEDFIETIKDPMKSCHFSLSFRIKQEAALLRIVGVLGHKDGHQEETELALPADNSGNKNAVQALGSSISYGKRYVGMTLLGIATEDEDDDGKAAVSVAKITEDGVSKLRSLIVDTNSDIPRFCRYMEKKTKTKIERLEDIPAASFDDAVAALEAKERGQL